MDSNSGILSENTKANYTERYDSLLKMKNHVTILLLIHTFPERVSSNSAKSGVLSVFPVLNLKFQVGK